MTMRRRRQQSKAFEDLSSLVLALLRSPPTPISFSDHQFPDSPPPPPHNPPHRTVAHISPSGFASLLLGISVALMLCGSVTFFIGFLLLPWVLALVMVFYVAGLVSAVSLVGRSVLCYVLSPSPSSGKGISEWKLL